MRGEDQGGERRSEAASGHVDAPPDGVRPASGALERVVAVAAASAFR
ncbi:hypothetical protein AB0A99_26735 [Streptomyces fradiae]